MSKALRQEWVGAGRAKPSRPEVYGGVIEGETRWVKGYGLGIHFIFLL